MSDERFVMIPVATLETLISMARSHVEDIESGVEEGIYLASENQDVGQKKAAIELAEGAFLAGLNGAVESLLIGSIEMQSIVGDYDVPETVPEWQWVQRNASFAHAQNGQDGVWEYQINLSRNFDDVPDSFRPVIEHARLKGIAYLLFHQGT